MTHELETWSWSKAEYGVAYLSDWSCEDPYCGCEQLSIFRYLPPDPEWPLRPVTKTLWEGEFHTDHEGYGKADFEAALAALIEFDAVPMYPRWWAEYLADYGLTTPVAGEGR